MKQQIKVYLIKIIRLESNKFEIKTNNIEIK